MRALVLTIASLSVAACASDPKLMNIRAGQTSPDEFAVLPTKPLSMPPDLADLPAPTPGGANLTDPTPVADATAALGGNPAAAMAGGGMNAADAALVAHAARTGSDPAIRARLAANDAAFRDGRGRRPLEVLFGTSAYQRAYRGMALDLDAELERWRRAGAQTPSAPPRR